MRKHIKYVLGHQEQPEMDDVMAGSGARLLILGVKDNLKDKAQVCVGVWKICVLGLHL